MGFLATVWGRRKHMPCSKKEAQQHIYDKKAHGRNISKGDKTFVPRCPLCSCNDETQAHLLLRCEHPIMKYWRKDYFRCCEEIIGNNPDKTPRDFLGDLWKWVGYPLVSEADPEINKDSRRVGLMMGIPIKTDLEEQGQGTNLRMNAGEQKSMHSTMIALWVKSIEFAIITWRTRGFLRATPDAILSWYGRGEITADMVKGVFEHQFTSIKETSKEYQATIYGQVGFKIGRASRPSVVVRSRAKRAREKDISLNARNKNSKRLRQGQLEQVTGARVKAVQVPSQQEEMRALKLKDKETRAAKKKGKHWRRYKRRLTGPIASVSCKDSLVTEE
jgi:hypothetical protein